MAFKISNLLATDKAQAAKTLLDGGLFVVYGGAEPANADATASATVLATIQLESPAFGAIANGVMSLVLPSPSTWSATGTATHFRGFSNGSPGLSVCQGNVGTSGSDAIINSTSAVLGGPVSLLTWVYTQPKA